MAPNFKQRKIIPQWYLYFSFNIQAMKSTSLNFHFLRHIGHNLTWHWIQLRLKEKHALEKRSYIGGGRKEGDSSKAGLKLFFQWESMNWKVIYGIHNGILAWHQSSSWVLSQALLPQLPSTYYFFMTFDLSQRFSKSQTLYFRLYSITYHNGLGNP